ncbi:MAG TPA: UDP-N-acetylglucosamine 2-epimerase (non-hydrolyzing) [Trinickia sp.]|uniref:non-hydrolyzing UDP-N-acetylglucosamine 2-epimerase n=1 Tax=Trinickia sp. TaxID=2571163 RepID=UPI002B626915|nr:UDP-N-acetylglucosamine 2-epimerase (non-hydrolyzing) [Trinickia sp.]HVW52326.1 UDP-N-acetylglucosamine 2-epimerase (non-hydrolyzing) [Trinickia sp.]
MKKVYSVVGARPQFVKAAVVAHAFARQTNVEHHLVHTGQHFDENMSGVFFNELEIPAPLHQLEIGGLSHGAMTGRMLEQMEAIFMHDRPDVVIVYGDTNSTLAGALAAVKIHIPVAHVEAGLRSMNRAMPEEINRIATDHVSDLLFAPHAAAADQLMAEGIPLSKISTVGDVMFDASLTYSRATDNAPDVLTALGLEPDSYVLATVHRAENTDSRERLEGIVAGFAQVEQPIVLPLHPRTRGKLASFGLELPSNVRLIEPVGFRAMLQLERHARCVVTDSGGVQKEAFFMRKPCVTLRDETEWTELVSSGWNVLVGAKAQAIAAAIASATTPVAWPSLYGQGDASDKIVARVLELPALAG